MKKFTNCREIIIAGIIRFSTNFFSLQRLVRQKTALRDMWESREWLSSRLGRSKVIAVKEVRLLMLSSTKETLLFWKHADKVLKLFESLIRVLRYIPTRRSIWLILYILIRFLKPFVKLALIYELLLLMNSQIFFLPLAIKEIKQWIAEFAPKWKKKGITLTCDGWTSSTKLDIINFLVYPNGFTVFHKSINELDVQRKDAYYLFKLMKRVVEEVGAEKVVRTETKRATPMKAAGKRLMEELPHLYWTACATHCIDLILEGFGKFDRIANVIFMARIITNYIYKHE